MQKQMNPCRITQITQNERVYIAAGQYPRRMSRTFIVNHQAWQVIMVLPCVPSRYAARNILQGIVDDSRRRGRP